MRVVVVFRLVQLSPTPTSFAILNHMKNFFLLCYTIGNPPPTSFAILNHMKNFFCYATP